MPLTDVERKMLYFSKNGWTLPDMAEVKEAFDREYDRPAFEKKIKVLIRKYQARSHAEDEEEFEAWKEAIRTLRKEDCFLRGVFSGVGQPGNMGEIWITALVILGVILAAMYLAGQR